MSRFISVFCLVALVFGTPAAEAAPRVKFACMSNHGMDRIELRLVHQLDDKFALEFFRTGPAIAGAEPETRRMKVARALRCKFGATDARVLWCTNSPVETGDAMNSYLSSSILTTFRLDAVTGEEAVENHFEIRALSPATLVAEAGNPYIDTRGTLALTFNLDQCESY